MDLFSSSIIKPAVERGQVVTVIPLRPIVKGYSYKVPKDKVVQAGDYVRIPIGNSTSLGVVWDSSLDEQVDYKRIKEILEIFDIIPMQANLRRFIEWVSAYTLSPIGLVLKMAIAGEICLELPQAIKAFRLTDDFQENIPLKMTLARERVIAFLKDVGGATLFEISNETGVTSSVVKGLEKINVVESFSFQRENSWSNRIEKIPSPPEMSVIQKMAVDSLIAMEKNQKFSVAALDGVTGSGKTEVYFAPIRTAVTTGKQVLVLVPEIALTQQFLGRFKKRFGVEPAQWHSIMTPAQRRKVWRGVAKGEIQVVVGARSSLFLPFEKLGLIIVDEEHDPSYKQEEGGTIYQARDMAIVRARHEDCPIILVSATPSLETMQNVWTNKYRRYHLPDRHGGAVLPEISLIDMRKEKLSRQSWLSGLLVDEIKKTLENGEQSLLFLNRRGYAPLILCRKCGFRLSCPKCTSWLVEHKSTNRLICHHCGYNELFPKFCPECEGDDTLASCGPGVERIYEETLKYFPSAEICVLSSDIQKNARELSEALDAISERRFDIIIGTQIIAKGHHFPHLTMVGVVDADLGLSGSDLRAGERTFQLLQQVSGRAGREKQRGKVFLQTYIPEHPLMQSLVSNNRDEFYAQEALAREQANMPPFSRLVAIIVVSEKDEDSALFSKSLVKKAPNEESVVVLGPAPAVIHKLRGVYRYRILLRCDKSFKIQSYIRNWLAELRLPKGVNIAIDVDPYSFM